MSLNKLFKSDVDAYQIEKITNKNVKKFESKIISHGTKIGKL